MAASALTPFTIPVICGPTASGKSALALELARQLGGVIINADSMQVYDALHVLTAQPDKQEQKQAPHRLYAVLGPAEKCTAGHWRALAVAEIERARAEGKTPIIVGGTGFYIKVLTDGLSPIPDIPPEYRERAMQTQAELGNAAFHAALARKDPAMAAKLGPNDTQRMMRAWEVLEFTGKSLAYWQSLPPEGPPPGCEFEIRVVVPDREELYRRCDARFDAMLERGIIAETKKLDMQIAAGLVPPDAPVTHALGFHPLQAFIHDKCTIEQAIAQAKLETRQYAKRQLTWFRNQL